MKADGNNAFFIPGDNAISSGEENDIDQLNVSFYFLTFRDCKLICAFSLQVVVRSPEFQRSTKGFAPARRLPSTDPSNFSSLLLINMILQKPKILPCTSLADFRGFSLALETEPAELDSPLKCYQAIESHDWLSTVGAYKLHLKDTTLPEFKELRFDDKNLLAGSWTFHQFFDGLYHWWQYNRRAGPQNVGYSRTGNDA